MYRAINGIYEDGKLFLTETPPTTKESKVIILFMKEVEEKPLAGKRISDRIKKSGDSLPNDLNE